MAIFETVWQAVRDDFYDPNMNGVDWQAVHDQHEPRILAAEDGETYYRLLNEMVFELDVSHIGVLPPEMAEELDPITFPAGSLGFDVRIKRFDLAEPSLDDIFVNVVANGGTYHA